MARDRLYHGFIVNSSCLTQLQESCRGDYCSSGVLVRDSRQEKSVKKKTEHNDGVGVTDSEKRLGLLCGLCSVAR